MPSHSSTTRDHEEIRRWAEARNGIPAAVKNTGTNKDSGTLRIDFPNHSEGPLVHISWEEFFKKFDEGRLEFLYQEKTAEGNLSLFNKFISGNGKK